jgi:hypothetical protein
MCMTLVLDLSTSLLGEPALQCHIIRRIDWFVSKLRTRQVGMSGITVIHIAPPTIHDRMGEVELPPAPLAGASSAVGIQSTQQHGKESNNNTQGTNKRSTVHSVNISNNTTVGLSTISSTTWAPIRADSITHSPESPAATHGASTFLPSPSGAYAQTGDSPPSRSSSPAHHSISQLAQQASVHQHIPVPNVNEEARTPEAIGTVESNPAGLPVEDDLFGDESGGDDEFGEKVGDELALQADRELGEEMLALGAAPKEAAQTEQIRFATFDSRLRFFKYMLFLAALHPKTAVWYRAYLRISTWGCTLMCLLNIFFQTKSYRSPLFDVTLVLMHLWVSLSLERWVVFLRTQHWRQMMQIVIRRHSSALTAQLNLGGILGLVLVAGAVATVCTAWIVPIWIEVFRHVSMSEAKFGFMTLHGVFMSLIIVPWSVNQQ